jgi:3-oxoacyl-[acyl-carrier-protein] synthase-1
MNTAQTADILAVGMVTPVGLTARSTAAAIRAGICRTRESPCQDKNLESLLMGFLDDEHLPALVALNEFEEGTTERYQRMLRLATRALQEVSEGWQHMPPPPLILALPESRPGHLEPTGEAVVKHLVAQTGVKLAQSQSRVFRQGRAGGLLALQHALELLRLRRATHVCVGGVDTHLDEELLATLDGEDRLLVHGLSDGFIPGEGAAFLLLGPTSRSRRPTAAMARITGVGSGTEKGHLYSQEPYRGDGLADAFRALFSSLPTHTEKVRCVYAGLNGEHLWSKEWGVALLRNARHFEDAHRIEHPIECIGDPGAALGPLLVGLAALGIHKGYRQGPCLAWCSSDREERAAALVQAAVT